MNIIVVGNAGMDSIKVYEKHQKLIHSIYSSRLKIQILLTLLHTTASLGQLRDVTGSTSQALIPKIRSLERQGLIEAVNYEYHLTPFGGVVATNVEGFVQLIGGIDQHHTFFTDHDLSDIPAAFLLRIGDLYNSEPKQDTTTDMFYVYSHYLEILKDAAYIHGISSVASPGLARFIAEKVVTGIPVELVVNNEVVELLTKEPYASNMQGLAGFPNFSVWVTVEKLRVGLTVTGKYLSLGLFKKDTNLYDSSSDLFSSDPHAVEWGESLFRYYKERSTGLDIAALFEGE
ncbi:MAG: transcriptional regulator FilR1 domain-containing protein [Methanoregula sp.]|jgi:predicted transcriptional regulator